MIVRIVFSGIAWPGAIGAGILLMLAPRAAEHVMGN